MQCSSGQRQLGRKDGAWWLTPCSLPTSLVSSVFNFDEIFDVRLECFLMLVTVGPLMLRTFRWSPNFLAKESLRAILFEGTNIAIWS